MPFIEAFQKKKTWVTGRENGYEEDEENCKLAVPCGMNLDSFVSFFSTTVLKHIVDNGWWGCGHKNTRHSMWVFFLLTIYIVGGA